MEGVIVDVGLLKQDSSINFEEDKKAEPDVVMEVQENNI